MTYAMTILYAEGNWETFTGLDLEQVTTKMKGAFDNGALRCEIQGE